MNVNDLITHEKYVIQGFKWQAKKKSELTEGILKYSSEAKKILKKITINNNTINKILKDELLFDFIIGATMLSKKSLQHFSSSELKKYIKHNINFKRINEQNYLNELERYYLMTAGDSIGGKIRNMIGKKGNDIFINYIENYFKNNNINYDIISKNNNIQKIYTDKLVILFNKKPNFIGKSVDFMVLKKYEDGSYDIEDHKQYISAGELKSGIDPAGADEHWKTASTALKRIHLSFIKKGINSPNIYFIGGAISRHMASEIINNIENDKLKFAANLNYESQMKEMIQYLLNI
jgi:hypothetical protein